MAATGEPAISRTAAGPRTAGHELAPVGAIVVALARWRVITLPVIGLIATAVLVGATRVESRFSFTDFVSSDTDFIVGLDLLEEHFGSSEGRTSYIYVEGDLTDPAAIAAIDGSVERLDASGAELSRETDGSLVAYPNAATVVRQMTVSAAARQLVADETGVVVSDADFAGPSADAAAPNGIPSDRPQIEAILTTALTHGVDDDAGGTVLPADAVAEIVWTDGTSWATTVTVGVPTATDRAIIYGAWDALDATASELSSGPAGDAFQVVSVSGEAVLEQEGLDGFTRAMLIAMPIALLAAIGVAAVFMRSLKHALVSVLSVLLVVAAVYAFMFVAGYAINPVTATIAAVAVGVGIDYATHLTVRFRQELAVASSRLGALRAAGSGTGSALVISALTSIVGFAVMAFAPMPIFAVFGVLIAVVIALALLVSLVVLPSLLLLVTPATSSVPTRSRTPSLAASTSAAPPVFGQGGLGVDLGWIRPAPGRRPSPADRR